MKDILEKIEALIVKNKYKEAYKIINSLFETGCDDAELYFYKSQIINALVETEKAIEWVDEALKRDEKNSRYLFFKAKWLLSIYNFEKAIETLTSLIEINDEFYLETGYFFRAIAFYEIKKNDSCINDLSYVRDDFSLYVMNQEFSKKGLLSMINKSS